jgi:hypothetical protein
MRGPFSLSINDESGLLVDGFDRPPSVMMGHARPYYAARLEALGLTKAKDLIAYDYDATPPLPKLMAAMVDKVSTTGELEIRPCPSAISTATSPSSWTSSMTPGPTTGASCRSPRAKSAISVKP